jgi:hypothetical protein
MNYSRVARTTKKLITKDGTKATLRIPAGRQIWDDDSASWITGYEEHKGMCLVTSYEQKDIDGSLIKAGDRKLLCVFPAEPESKVSLVDVYKKTGALDATYTVEDYSALVPDATTVILFKIQGRK